MRCGHLVIGLLWLGAVTSQVVAQWEALPPSTTLTLPAINWQPRFHGVAYTQFQLASPRAMRLHALRVQLGVAGIALVTDEDNGERPLETDGLKTSTFLLRRGCQAAINAAPFAPIHAEEGLPQDVSGLVVSEWRLVSPPLGDLPALLWCTSGKAAICRPPFALNHVKVATGGFSIVLSAGKVVHKDESIHPRTGAGVSADGCTLYLLVIDGRQPGFSEGAQTHELGEVLRQLGAADGINLDGGGTSTMVLADGGGGFEVVNRPIHAGEPGRQRVAASHLGIRALPLSCE